MDTRSSARSRTPTCPPRSSWARRWRSTSSANGFPAGSCASRCSTPRGSGCGVRGIVGRVGIAARANGNGAGPRRSRSIAIVGAGFGGVGAATMLRRAGYEDVTVFERGERVGGVWNHNTYPGAACDVPSHLYEFSFEPNARWSRRYAPQAEIQAYLEDVARSEGVLDRIRTSTEVQQARWDAERGKWVLQTSAGEHECDVLLTACGQLSVPTVPPLPGLDSFEGPAFHTAQWRHDVDLAD